MCDATQKRVRHPHPSPDSSPTTTPRNTPGHGPSWKLNANSTPIDDGAKDAQPIIDCCLSNDLSCRLGAASSNVPRRGDANRSVQPRHAASLPKDGDGQRRRGADRLHDGQATADDGTEETDAPRRPLRSPGCERASKTNGRHCGLEAPRRRRECFLLADDPAVCGPRMRVDFLGKGAFHAGTVACRRPFSDRRLPVVLPLLPPHSNPRGACAGSGPSGPHTHRAPFLDTAPRIRYTRSSTLSTPVPLTVATTDTCSTPVPCPVVPLGLPHPTSCPSPPNVSYTRGFPPPFSWAFRPRFVEIVRGGRRNRAFQAGRAPFSEQRPVRPHPSVPMTP